MFTANKQTNKQKLELKSGVDTARELSPQSHNRKCPAAKSAVNSFLTVCCKCSVTIKSANLCHVSALLPPLHKKYKLNSTDVALNQPDPLNWPFHADNPQILFSVHNILLFVLILNNGSQCETACLFSTCMMWHLGFLVFLKAPG